METTTAIVPTYERAEFLGECLESVLGQSRPPDQVIVLDDGSTDRTRAVVESYGTSIEYRFQPNAGKSAALNHALSLATGDRIWIVDDDDLALPDALATLSGVLDARPDAGFAFGRHLHFSASSTGERTLRPPARPAFDANDLFFALLRKCFIFQPGMLVRRHCYDAVGPFDVDLARAQDYEMLLRLAARFPAAYLDAVVFHQREHNGLRGPAHLRVDGANIFEHQEVFDAQVLSKVHREAALDAFLPWGKRVRHDDPASNTAYALYRRSASLCWRSHWKEAAADLRRARASMHDPAMRADLEQVMVEFARIIDMPNLRNITGFNGFLGTMARAFPKDLHRAVISELFAKGVAKVKRALSDRRYRAAIDSAQFVLVLATARLRS